MTVVKPAPATVRKALDPLIGLASIAVPLWMLRQTYLGNKDVWELKHQDHHAEMELQDMQYAWGFDPGQPAMGHWAHQLYRWTLFGPWGILTTYCKYKYIAQGILNDVILQNLAPIALGIAGAYAGFGKEAVHKPFKEIWKVVGPLVKKIPVGDIIGGIGRGIANGVGGALRGLGFLMKGANIRYTLPLVGLLGFGLLRFNRVYNHETQHDKYRDFTNLRGGGSH